MRGQQRFVGMPRSGEPTAVEPTARAVRGQQRFAGMPQCTSLDACTFARRVLMVTPGWSADCVCVLSGKHSDYARSAVVAGWRMMGT